MKLVVSLLITLSAATGFAADLSRASNQELLNELARRLNTSSAEAKEDTGYAIASCSSGVTLVIRNEGSETKQTKEIYVGSSCPEVLKSMSKKLGKIRGIERAAFCTTGVTLVNVTLHGSGKIEMTDNYVGSNCPEQADFINNLR